MTFVWLLPTLIAGLVLALVTHSWIFLLLSLVTAATSLLGQKLRSQGNLDGPVSISGAGVAIGDRVLPKNSRFWRPEWQAKVFEAVQTHLAQQNAALAVGQMVESGFRLEDAEAIEALVGFGSEGEVKLNLAIDGPHLFVIGPTGSGKSRWLELHLSSLINSHQNLDFWYADFKGGATLGRFAGHSSCVAFTTDLDGIDDFWDRLTNFVHQREVEFAELKIARIEQATATFRRQIVVVDELLPAIRSSLQAINTIETIATRGRSLGIHLIAASQGTSGMGRVLLTNLRAKLILVGTDSVDLAQLGISQKLKSEPVAGQANGMLATSSGVTWFSFPLLFRPANFPVTPRRVRGRRQPGR